MEAPQVVAGGCDQLSKGVYIETGSFDLRKEEKCSKEIAPWQGHLRGCTRKRGWWMKAPCNSAPAKCRPGAFEIREIAERCGIVPALISAWRLLSVGLGQFGPRMPWASRKKRYIAKFRIFPILSYIHPLPTTYAH